MAGAFLGATVPRRYVAPLPLPLVRSYVNDVQLNKPINSQALRCSRQYARRRI